MPTTVYTEPSSQRRGCRHERVWTLEAQERDADHTDPRVCWECIDAEAVS